MFLDCRSLEWRAVKLPDDVAIVSANSMVKHQLGDSAYRTRVQECAEAARRLGASSLRDAESDKLAMLDGVYLKRARHVVTENARVVKFVAAADVDDAIEMGRIVTESHISLRDDYEVSLPYFGFPGGDGVTGGWRIGRADDRRRVRRIHGESVRPDAVDEFRVTCRRNIESTTEYLRNSCWCSIARSF